MAQKDSQLVVRARDEASKALQAITKAVGEFEAAQASLAGSGATASSTLGKLAGSIKELGAASNALTGVDKIAAQMQRAEKAVGSLESKLASANTDLSTYSAKLEEAAQANTQLQSRATAATTAVERQAKAVVTLAAEQRKLATAERQALAAAARANTRVAGAPNGPTLLTKKAEADARAAQAKAALTAKTEALEREKAALASLQAAQEPLLRQATEAAKVEKSFTAAVEAAKFSIENLSAGIGPARAGLAEIAGMFETGAKAAGLETASVEALTNAQQSLRASTLAATQAFAAEQARQKTTPSKAGTSTLTTQESFANLTQASATLASMVKAEQEAGAATAQTTAAINVQRAAVNEAQDAYKQAAINARVLAGAEAGAAAAAKRMSDEAGRMAAAAAAAYIQTVSLAEAERRAQEAAAASATALHAQQAALTPLVRMLGAYREAVNSASAAVDHSRTGHDGLGASVRNLAGAYLTVFTAINAFKSVVDASVNAEAAQVRISTALGQGVEAGAQAYQHAANAARQLRLDILPTVDAYGSFLAVTKDTAIEGDKARKIFDDLLIAARAFKLSPENLERATLALKDMAAKGTIARREINQLDLALPVGTLQALAEAAGYGAGGITAFNKAVHAGTVDIGILPKAMDLIADRAQKGLPDALNTAQSALANLRNSIFDLSVSIGQGQFMEGIVAGANALSAALKSDDTVNGLRAISSAFGSILSAIAALLPYTKQILEALTALAAIKIVGWVVGFGEIASVVGGVVTGIKALVTGTALAEGAFAGLALTAEGAGVALAGIVGFLTGPVGIAVAVAAIGASLAAWAMNTTNAEDSLRSYQTTMDRVKGALKSNGGDLSKVGSGVGDPNVGDVDKEVARQRTALNSAKTALAEYISGLGTGVGAVDAFGNALDTSVDMQVQALKKLGQEYANGKITGDQFRDSVKQMQASLSSDEAKNVATSLLAQSEAIKTTGDHLADTATAAQGMGSKMEGLDSDVKHGTSTLTDFAAALKDTSGAMEVAGVKALDDYASALKKIEALIPGMKEKLKDLQDNADISANFKKGMDALNSAYQNGAINAEDYRSGKRQLQGATDDAAKASDGTTVAIASALVEHLMQKYGVNRNAAIGAVGVMGYESGDFKSLQERNPVGGGRGGYGYTQSTGPRRDDEDAFFAAHPDLDPSSLEGQTRWFDQEASGKYSGAMDKLRGQTTVQGGADTFLQNFEGMNRPADGTTTNPDGGVPAYAQHEARAEQYARILPDSAKKDAAGQMADVNSKEKDAAADAANDAAAEAHTQKELQSEKDLAALAAAKTKAAKEYDDYKKAHPEAGAEELTAAKQKIDANVQSLEVEKEVDQFKERNKTATADEVAQYRQLVAAKVAAADAEKSASSGEVGGKHDAIESQKELNALVAEHANLVRKVNQEGKTGSVNPIDASKLKEVDAQIDELIKKLREMYQAMGGADGAAGIARLDAISNDLSKARNEAHLFGLSMEDTKKVANDLASDLSSFADNFAKKIADGEKPMQALRESFLQFASEFLQQIAKMIIQQAIFNALGLNKSGDLTGGGLLGGLGGAATGAASGGGGGLFGGLGSILSGLFHGGGVVGAGSSAGRTVSALAFVNARRMHEGGIVGLSSDERPIIAKNNEEVLTRDDPRHVANGGGAVGRAAAQSVKVVNAFDPASFISHGLSTTQGETAMMNFVRANSSAIKGALGS